MEPKEPKQINEYTDLELAQLLSQETNALAFVNQQAQIHAANIQQINAEIERRTKELKTKENK